MSLTPVKSGRARALDAALSVLREHGFAAVTMRSVAEAAGMTAPALYWHYQDKDALLRDVYREVTAVHRHHVYSALGTGNAVERLRAALEALRTFAVAEPNLYEVLYLAPPPAGAPRSTNTMLHLVDELVRNCMRENALEDADPSDVALTVSAHAHGTVQQFRRGQFDSEAAFAAFHRRSFDRLLAGIARDG
ncbi:MAG TPA: TetR/AcrR family transcriptional regulator [Gemmatimonadaceae bacterium]|nr:TetR/AcrR family transcriptional regulator [Gemmatimonadaceae bacterium]